MASSISMMLYKNEKYIIEENNRVVAASALLDQNNLKGFGEKMYASHEGLSKLYEVSCPELDFLVDFTGEFDDFRSDQLIGHVRYLHALSLLQIYAFHRVKAAAFQ